MKHQSFFIIIPHLSQKNDLSNDDIKKYLRANVLTDLVVRPSRLIDGDDVSETIAIKAIPQENSSICKSVFIPKYIEPSLEDVKGYLKLCSRLLP